MIIMDVKKAIETRRSIRKYLDREVPGEVVMKLIEAARLSPSGNNAQPWKFFVVDDEKAKSTFRNEKVFPQEFVASSPVIIVCCSDPKAYNKNIGGLDDANKSRALRDLSIASAHIVLRATELGLGTCYVGWRDEVKLKKVLGISEDYILPYIITVGYADENPEARARKEMGEIILS